MSFAAGGLFKLPVVPNFAGGSWTLPDSFGLPFGAKLFPDGTIKIDGKLYWSFGTAMKLPAGITLPAGVFALPDGTIAINTSLFKTPFGSLPAGAIVIPKVDTTLLPNWKGWNLPEGGIMLPSPFNVNLPGIGSVDIGGGIALPNGDIQMFNGDLWKFGGVNYTLQNLNVPSYSTTNMGS